MIAKNVPKKERRGNDQGPRRGRIRLPKMARKPDSPPKKRMDDYKPPSDSTGFEDMVADQRRGDHPTVTDEKGRTSWVPL